MENEVQEVAMSDLADLELNISITLGDLEELANHLENHPGVFRGEEPAIARDLRAKFDQLTSELEAGIAEVLDTAVSEV